jgi:hypothetical protein
MGSNGSLPPAVRPLPCLWRAQHGARGLGSESGPHLRVGEAFGFKGATLAPKAVGNPCVGRAKDSLRGLMSRGRGLRVCRTGDTERGVQSVDGSISEVRPQLRCVAFVCVQPNGVVSSASLHRGGKKIAPPRKPAPILATAWLTRRGRGGKRAIDRAPG